jgi:hypothetical protein
MSGLDGFPGFLARQHALRQAEQAAEEARMKSDLSAALLVEDLIQTTKAGTPAPSTVYLRVRAGLVLIVEPIPNEMYKAAVCRATFRPGGGFTLKSITQNDADWDEAATMLEYFARRREGVEPDTKADQQEGE